MWNISFDLLIIRIGIQDIQNLTLMISPVVAGNLIALDCSFYIGGSLEKFFRC